MDEFEMGDFNNTFPEYDGISNDDLNTRLLDLRNDLVNGGGDVADTTERIRYIEDRLEPPIGETSLVEGSDGTVTISTGGEGEVSVPSILSQGPPTMASYVTAVDKFIQDKHKLRVNWSSDEGLRLRDRLDFTKGGKKTLC